MQPPGEIADSTCDACWCVQLSERLWKTRIHVTGEYGKEEGVFEITMVQRLGGRYGESIAWYTFALHQVLRMRCS